MSDTPALTAEERETVARFDAAPVLAEAFDATAACHRVLDFAKRYERGEIGDPGRAVVAWMIHVALTDRVLTAKDLDGAL